MGGESSQNAQQRLVSQLRSCRRERASHGCRQWPRDIPAVPSVCYIQAFGGGVKGGVIIHDGGTRTAASHSKPFPFTAFSASCQLQILWELARNKNPLFSTFIHLSIYQTQRFIHTKSMNKNCAIFSLILLFLLAPFYAIKYGIITNLNIKKTGLNININLQVL